MPTAYTDTPNDHNNHPRYANRLFAIRRQQCDVYVQIQRDDREVRIAYTFECEAYPDDSEHRDHWQRRGDTRRDAHLLFLQKEQELIDAVREGKLVQYLNVQKSLGKFITRQRNKTDQPQQKGRR